MAKENSVKSKLETRKAIKARKPTYKRVQSRQFAKLSETKWRRPKGMGNKDRRNRKGHIGMLKIGYGSPSEIRGANREGLFEVIVKNVTDLDSIDSKTQVGVVSQTLGNRKKIEVLKAAKDKKVVISNVKDIDSKIKELTKDKKVEKKAETKKESVKDKKSTESKKEDKKKGGGNK